MIKAPNAIRNVFAGAPLSLLNKLAYCSSSSSHGIALASFTHRLSLRSFHPKGR